MANASKFLDKRFKLSDGTFKVRIRVTHERKSIYLNTKYSFDEDTYTKKIVAGKNMNNNEELLRAKKGIQEIEDKAKEVIDNLSVFTFEDFKNHFEQKGNRSDLITLLSQQSETLKAAGKFSNANIYGYAADMFKQYANFKFKSDIFKVSQVTPNELSSFQEWAEKKILDKNGVVMKKAYSVTTISMYLVRVQKILNNLLATGELKKSLYPFGAKLFQIPQSINNKRPLTVDEIMLLVNYVPTTKVQDFAKSMFMFSYLCSGMNMADIFKLRNSDINNGKITFIRQKTKGKGKLKTLSINITPEIQQIIDSHKVHVINSDYIFKVYNDNMTDEQKYKAKDVAIGLINRSLKEIAKKIGLPSSISTYFARHSYATILMETGAPTIYISKRLGHSDLSTTEKYLSQFSKEKEEAFEANLLKKA
ncbi:tyrosine-type recombinase/integrase [Pedobacter sp. Du54]|uniref:tyrosine-type recombinase/integrase n=1 Tax=Pedobacter anseongensis TaxID=3133439 RepID=UPI0030995486